MELKPAFIIAHKYLRGYDSYMDHYIENIHRYYPEAMIVIVDNNSVHIDDISDNLKKYKNITLLDNKCDCKFEIGAYQIGLEHLISSGYLSQIDFCVFTQDTFILKNKFDFNELKSKGVKAASFIGWKNDLARMDVIKRDLEKINLFNKLEETYLCWCNSFIISTDKVVELYGYLKQIVIKTRYESEACERYLGRILLELNNGSNYAIDGKDNTYLVNSVKLDCHKIKISDVITQHFCKIAQQKNERTIEGTRKACVYFHQGWTDIVMCMALINYYRSKYNETYVLIRSDAQGIVDFYVRNLKDVKIIYIETDNGRFHGNFLTSQSNYVEYYNGDVLIPANFHMLFHGEHDRFRKDHYANYWHQPDSSKKPARHFSEMFYIFYDIDFSVRIKDFNVDRDIELEENSYAEFVKKHGDNYVIYHDDEANHLRGPHHISTKIDFKEKIEGCNYINVNKQSNIFFDYIKIFQKAKEVHLIDSIWACIFYQLDAKYGILNGKKISLYCKRGHQNLFQYPIKLGNWDITF